MKFKTILGRFFQFLLILLAAIIIVLNKNIIFVIISIIFLVGGAIYEHILLNKFQNPKAKKSKDSWLYQGFIYTHFMMDFFNKYKEGIYNFSIPKNFLKNLFPYFIVLLYIGILSILFRKFGAWTLLIYLIPAITNIISFWKYNYQIN